MKTTPHHDPVQQVRLVDIHQWLQMMGRLDDPVVARLVHQYLSENGAARDQHPGAFLKALETVKRSQISYAKAYARGKLAGFLAQQAARLAVAAVRFTGKVFAGGVRQLSGSGRQQVHLDLRPVQALASPRVRCPVTQRRAELQARRHPAASVPPRS